MTSVTYLPWVRVPEPNACWNSARRRTRRLLPKHWDCIVRRPAKPAESSLARGGNGEPLAALGPAALEDEPAVFRGHAHQKAVCATATTAVGLERTLHDVDIPCPSKRVTEKR